MEQTIKERIGLCEHCLTDETRFCHTDCHIYSKYKGATEQRKIDIEKACAWFENWFLANKWYTMEESIEMLRKAMEK